VSTSKLFCNRNQWNKEVPMDNVQSGAGVAALVREGELAGRWQLDARASRVEVRGRHFWDAITVRGWFEQVEGGGPAGPDGTVAGQLVVSAAPLSTRNKERDKPVRAGDFSDADSHPRVVVPGRGAARAAEGGLPGEGPLGAGGMGEPIASTADVV